MGAAKYMNYLEKKATFKDLQNLTLKDEIEEMKQFQEEFGKFKNKNFIYEVIQSYPAEESKKLGAKKIHDLGQELAKRSFFSEHQYVVITHTDKAHFHNHIIVNPVHPENGKRLYRDMKYRNQMMALSNKISKENGLSIIERTAIEKNESLHPKATKMNQRYGQSYELDLMQKADFARAYSTSFSEYEAILGEMNVGVRITDKTISYLYQGKQKRKRGDKIGRRYTKEGLSEKFESNRELFSKNPELRSEILSSIRDITDPHGNIVKAPSPSLLDGGGHEKFIKKGSHRFSVDSISQFQNLHPSDQRLSQGLIPLATIREARNGNILKYAERNRIGMIANSEGETFLKGREHVQLFDYEWINTKNRTRGSLIDFVAVHENTTYLRAISKITENPRLLLLEKQFGEVKRPYTPFHIPNLSNAKDSEKHLRQFFRHHKIEPESHSELYQLKNIRSDKNGNVWFLPQNDRSGAIEYHRTEEDPWEKRKHGEFHSPFFQKTTKNKEGVIFFDPVSFIRHKKVGDILATNHGSNILTLFEPNEKAVDLFFAQNPHIKSIFFSPSNGKEFETHEINLIETLSQKYRQQGVSIGKSLLELDITRKSREFDISF